MNPENSLLEAPPEKNNLWKDIFKLFAIAVLVVLPFRLFIAQPFVVEGASMDPTFKSSDYLIVDEVTYRFDTPERGSVLIFKYPRNPKKYFVKRVIGLPGEKVSINNGQVTIINTENPDGFKIEEPYVLFGKLDDNESYDVGPDEYFVMGDNRSGSSDSRIWGNVPKDKIIGRPILRVYPFAIWPGNESELFDK